MSNAVFGKTIKRAFTADDAGEYLELPTQTPTIYLFTHGSAPSYADAVSGTGALQTVSSWTKSPTSPEMFYEYAAIADPTPSGSVLSYDYWECILYKLTSSAAAVPKIRMFTVHRADVLESIPSLTAADIEAIWSGVTQYITPQQLAGFLPIAEAEMRSEVGNEKWARLSKLSDARICLAYKAIEAMAASQVYKGNGDKFVWMVDYFGKKYTSAAAKLSLPFDSDGDGAPDTVSQPAQAVVISDR